MGMNRKQRNRLRLRSLVTLALLYDIARTDQLRRVIRRQREVTEARLDAD